MTAAARGSKDSLDALIEQLMHEGEDTDMPDGTIADAHNRQTLEEKQWAERDVDGRILHEQTINTDSWMTCTKHIAKSVGNGAGDKQLNQKTLLRARRGFHQAS